MKKILALVFAVALVLGIIQGVEETLNPQVGDTVATGETVDGGYTTMGNPPVGG